MPSNRKPLPDDLRTRAIKLYRPPFRYEHG
jgi:hypothetical protein